MRKIDSLKIQQEFRQDGFHSMDDHKREIIKKHMQLQLHEQVALDMGLNFNNSAHKPVFPDIASSYYYLEMHGEIVGSVRITGENKIDTDESVTNIITMFFIPEFKYALIR